MYRGYIKVWRKIKDNPLYDTGEPFDKLHAWLDLLLCVWGTEKKYLIGNKVYLLKPGQWFTSYRYLANRWHWRKDKAKAFLDLLASSEMDMIKVEYKGGTKGGTLITICNWELYQEYIEGNLTENRQRTDREPTENRQRTDKTENVKECKRVLKSVKECKRSKENIFVELFNSTCPSFPQVKVISKSRKTKIQLRLKEHPDLGWWKAVFEKIKTTPFLRGENKNNWKATFDWLIKNDTNALKVYEGTYDENKFIGEKQWLLEQGAKYGQV